MKNKTTTAIQQSLINDAWLNLPEHINDSVIQNPIKEIPEFAHEEPYLFLSYMLGKPEYIAAFCKYVLNVTILPYQQACIKTLWEHSFNLFIASRGMSKSWQLALYSLLRATFMPGRKIVICGASFRQSKVVYDYIDQIYNNAPLFKDMIKGTGSGGQKSNDVWRYNINGSTIVAIPMGTGEKIRGLRSQDLLIDEFKSVSVEIFEEVMSGFLAVSADPVAKVKKAAAKRKSEELGLFIEDNEQHEIMKNNQLILSGTAYYSFNHFYKYWMKWKSIIHSGGDNKKMSDYDDRDIPEKLNHKDYSVIRFPYELIPEDFLQEEQVARTRASINEGIFLNEFGACFATDSDGFFRRSLIEKCVCEAGKIYKNKEDCYFEPRLHGDPKLKYVMGIDPASERDNFCITILELRENHRRLVYCWTTKRSNHQARLKENLVDEHDFYSYINRKVRNLMERFNIEHIIMDSQGGGYPIIEAFKNTGNMKEYEKPILEIRDPKKPKPDDMRDGDHIVELASFADGKWFSEANHGMKKDLEDQVLLFPSFDALSLGVSIEQDKLEYRTVDTMQDCVEEIEELKDELCTIVMEQTGAGRERFVTPEEITGGKKRKQKKDRYSSLVIANMAARQIQNDDSIKIQPHIGGFAGNGREGAGPMYYGNEVYSKHAADIYADY